MNRLIPGKTKVQVELFRGVKIGDVIVAGIGLAMIVLILVSTLPYRFAFCLGVALIAAVLLVRLDANPNYVFLMHIVAHFAYKRRYGRRTDDASLLEKAREDETSPADGGNAGSRQGRKAAREKQREQREAAKAEALAKKRTKSASEKPQSSRPSAESGTGEEKISAKERERARKEEARLLKSGKLSEEEREAILARRRRESAEAAQKAALAREKKTSREKMQTLIGFTDIRDGYIEYGKEYYGGVIEIDPVEFRFFSEHRRRSSIESCFGRVLRSLHGRYSGNIIKLERPINYDRYLAKEQEKLEQLRLSFESGLLTEPEYQARVEISYDRLNELEALCADNKVIDSFFYLALFESDKNQLDIMMKDAEVSLQQGELTVRRLYGADLAVFLKYTNQLDFDEHEAERIRPEDWATWAQPQTVDVRVRRVEINHIITHNYRVVNYPLVVGDAWLAGVMSIPGTKVVVKFRQMDREKAVRGIDRSLMELRGQWSSTGVDSRRLEIETHLNTLQELLTTLQGDSEVLLECNIYITAFDIAATRKNLQIPQPPPSFLPTVGDMKKNVRRSWQEAGFRLNNMEFDQMQAFLGAQVSALDPLASDGRGIPGNTVAACFPWIFAHISDEGGIKLGESAGVPVFINFFRRDSERVNSNMVIVGKSGSGKSYATKSLLVNLAAEDAKIFILDPENEYTELAENLHGKFINVGNAQFGRLNPFHIITALDDDEAGEGSVSGSYATHLQFLEEFFKQILPDCDKDALEYLNNMVDRVYSDKGITPETDLSGLRPQDYPVFDDLYEAIFEEFQSTDNQYLRTMLRTLMNYIAKFSRDGRNANIWNGPSTVTTEENFTVFNFQSMLANRNTTIANAQMLLVLKYIDNEIIKNRDYNTRYGLSRKVVVVIDEAHVFIDTKFPVALDFMFQLAKRIRKYNGMQIVITQNIKDFVGSEEIARKSTAIINACQYSFIFALAPNDIQDLVKLYEKAGGINESEQEQITQAPRGQAFTIMGPSSRSTFRVETPKPMTEMFERRGYQSHYFSSPEGQEIWEEIAAESREVRRENVAVRTSGETADEAFDEDTGSGLAFVEIDADEEGTDADTLLFDEEDGEEEFSFGGETATGSTIRPTLPPDAPTYRAGPMQDALLGGIRELVDAVKGLSIDKLSSSEPEPAAPAAGAAEEDAGKPDEDARIRELRRTIEALQRQNEELQRNLEQAEQAAAARAVPEEEIPAPESGYASEAADSEAAPADTESDFWAQVFDDLPGDETWSGGWEEPSPDGSAAGQDDPDFASESGEWDLEPVPPTEEDLREQERRESEARSILERSTMLISRMSVLERMAASGENVMEITLEDLIAQIEYESKRV